MPLTPSEGWGVLHLYYRLDRPRACADPAAAKGLVTAVEALRAEDHQALVFSVIGHKADLGVMVLGPDLARLARFEAEVLEGPFEPVWSFVSLTETSPYTSTDDDERARLAVEEGITDAADVEARLGPWRERMAHYREHRLHPHLAPKALLCFYPMTKRRTSDDNWYGLDFDARKRLMAGHARVGRGYAGRVMQLITGSTGLDDWEWGVTLLADDPTVIKEIVHEMRFDEVSARYAEFGPFYVGIVGEPAAVLAGLGVA